MVKKIQLDNVYNVLLYRGKDTEKIRKEIQRWTKMFTHQKLSIF